jgi:hypothetical protein
LLRERVARRVVAGRVAPFEESGSEKALDESLSEPLLRELLGTKVAR